VIPGSATDISVGVFNFFQNGVGININHGSCTTNCHGDTNFNEGTGGTGQGITVNNIGGGKTVIPSIATDTGVAGILILSQIELVLVSTMTMVAVLPIVVEIQATMKVLVEHDKELLLTMLVVVYHAHVKALIIPH